MLSMRVKTYSGLTEVGFTDVIPPSPICALLSIAAADIELLSGLIWS